MSIITRCDGCGKELGDGWRNDDVMIHGEREGVLRGGAPVPDGEFDWCMDCAKTAFSAIRDLRAAPGRTYTTHHPARSQS